MAGNHYEQIIVNGGAVHAGDTIFNINFPSDIVPNELSPVDVRSIAGDLAETAEYCVVLEEALGSVRGAVRSLEELRNDVEELQCAVNTLKISVEDGFVDMPMPSIVQSQLLGLWPFIKRHKETLLDIKASVHRWHLNKTMVYQSVPPIDIIKATNVLKSLRRKMNTSIALVHLSTLHGFRQTSAEQMLQLRCRIENIQDELENQRLRPIPTGLSLSYHNLSSSGIVHDIHYPMQRYLETNSTHSKHSQPSMQVSTFRSSKASEAGTFVSAVEYMVPKPPKLVTLLRRPSSTPTVSPGSAVVDFTLATAERPSVSYNFMATTTSEDLFEYYLDWSRAREVDILAPRTIKNRRTMPAYHDSIQRALAFRRTRQARMQEALRLQKLQQKRELLFQTPQAFQKALISVFTDEKSTPEQRVAHAKEQLRRIGVKPCKSHVLDVNYLASIPASNVHHTIHASQFSRARSRCTTSFEFDALPPQTSHGMNPLFHKNSLDRLQYIDVTVFSGKHDIHPCQSFHFEVTLPRRFNLDKA